MFPNSIDRSRFNRRRRRLSSFIIKGQEQVSNRLEGLSETMVVDSIPVPVVKMAREKSYKSFRQSFETAPAKGYSAINKSWFIGYKLHVVIYENGVVQQSGITKDNVHDINLLKQIVALPANKQILGERAYISKTLRLDLFDQYQVKLRVSFMTNQHDLKKHPKKYKSKRQMVETFFS